MEIARQRQTYAAFEFSPLLSDCRGFLLKLDGRSKTWKKRFCVLCDACLYLYVDKEAHSAIGTFLRDTDWHRRTLNYFTEYVIFQPRSVSTDTASSPSAASE